MFLNLGFPIGTIMFLSISLIMYIIKKKYHDFQNKLFRFLLINTFCLLFLEIIYVITMNNIDKMPVLNEIVCRLFLAGIIFWILNFFFYLLSFRVLSLSSDKKAKLEKKILHTIIFGGILLNVIDCFFKVEYVTEGGLFAIVGPASYFVYGIAGLLMIILFFSVLKSKESYANFSKIPIFFVIFLIILDTINIFFLNINDLTLVLSLIVSSIFFTVESQDRMLLKEVGEAKTKSEEIDKAKKEFLANMSHEIRTPMNTILGFSNSLLLEKSLTKDKVLEDAKSINEASVDLLNLINNILDISRIESGRETITEKEYQLSDVLKEINALLRTKGKEKFNWYDLEINKDMPSGYYGDYSKVVKILNSLIINAVKYSLNGYINISVNYENKNNKDYLVFIITNSNSKINEEYCNQDFSDFSKLEYSSGNRMDSEFLGLVIAKRLIDMFDDSKIVFKRETNDITKCTISLCQKVSNKNRIGDVALNNTFDITDCTGKKALVVDDNEINLKLAERLLKSYNFTIFKATGGNECINLVKANDFDIILLDHMMPDLDGIKTMQILKSMNKKIPYIVAMTANSDSDSKEFYEKEGFDNYIGKPINKNSLDALMSELFGGKS